MKIQEYFDLHRAYLVGKKDLFTAKKQFILAPATIIALILLVGMIAGRNGSIGNEMYSGFFMVILYIGGLITTSTLFRDSHDSENIHNFLMLPASVLEKYLVRFLFSTLGLILIASLIVFASSLITSLLNLILYKASPVIFNPFLNRDIWFGVQGYLVLQAPFFLGAIWFRKHNLLKTVLSLLVIHILLGILTGGLGYVMIIRAFQDGSLHMGATEIFGNSFFSSRRILLFLRVLGQGVVPVTCWTAAYFRLKEAQVKDGV